MTSTVITDTSPATDASTRSLSSTPLRERPPRGRLVDAATETENRLSENARDRNERLTFGAVDVSWTSPLRNVAWLANETIGRGTAWAGVL